jgi:predicted GIY-YIG superfamily endonuclease
MPKKDNTPGRNRWTVYMLKCRDGSLYTGITNDLPRRLAAHAGGRGSRFVRSRLPFIVVRTEKKATRSGALKREAEIKGLDRKGKLALL